jgi:hypothetical protein
LLACIIFLEAFQGPHSLHDIASVKRYVFVRLALTGLALQLPPVQRMPEHNTKGVGYDCRAGLVFRFDLLRSRMQYITPDPARLSILTTHDKQYAHNTKTYESPEP